MAELNNNPSISAKHKHKLTVIIAVLIIAILFSVAQFLRIPFSMQDAAGVLEIQSQILSPSFLYVSSGWGGGGFSGHICISPSTLTLGRWQQFTGTRASSIDFRFRRATLNDVWGNLGTEDLTFAQSVFMNVPQTDYWSDINNGQQYVAWLAFDEPMSTQEMISAFPTIFVGGEIYSHNYDIDFLDDFAIWWLAIKTDDCSNAIALGTRGNLGRFNINPHVLNQERMQEIENCFGNSLELLVEHHRASDRIIDTGIWANAETVNFAHRLDYIQRNGVGYLGFIINIRGYDLRNLYDNGANIVRLIQDS